MYEQRAILAFMNGVWGEKSFDGQNLPAACAAVHEQSLLIEGS